MVQTGIPYFRLLFSTFLLAGIINNSATLFQALGKGWKASVIFLSRQIVFFIPLLMVLPGYFGISGVWLSMPVAEFLTILVIAILLVTEFRKLNYPSVSISNQSVAQKT